MCIPLPLPTVCRVRGKRKREVSQRQDIWHDLPDLVSRIAAALCDCGQAELPVNDQGGSNRWRL